MDWKEISSYLVSFFSFVWHMIPHTCEGWTNLFILLTVVVTFFGITLPRALNVKKCLQNKNNSKQV
jgi:hypothetical protein